MGQSPDAISMQIQNVSNVDISIPVWELFRKYWPLLSNLINHWIKNLTNIMYAGFDLFGNNFINLLMINFLWQKKYKRIRMYYLRV